MRAAIEAAKTGSVVLVSKGPLGRSGATVLSGADIMADGGSLQRLGYSDKPHDTPTTWADDILIEGFDLNDEGLVDVYTRDAGERVKEMLNWGMSVRDTEERALITTGMSICSALRRGLSQTARYEVARVEGVVIADLLVNQGRVVGALGVDFETGEYIMFRAKSIVLATGGWHQAYSFNAGSDELTGDGQGMAYRAGAELVDMEMVTFAPNILLAPPSHRGSLWFYLLPGMLLNSRGDAFLQWEDPKVAKLALTTEWNKLLFSKASRREVLAGRGSPLGGVYFSMKHMPENLFECLEKEYPGWRFQGDDFSELMAKIRAGYAAEVGPAAEYFEGGIRINERCETSLPGLYAAGECSGGLFGANRVAAATTEMVVHGKIAGEEAAHTASKVDLLPVDRAQVDALIEDHESLFGGKDGQSVSELRGRLREIAYEKVGVIRNEEHLTEAARELSQLESGLGEVRLVTKRRDHNREWLDAIELVNMVQCVRLAAQAALSREESRGVHVRSDHQEVDNGAWRKHLVLRRDGDDLLIGSEPVMSQRSLPQEKVPYEEMIVRAANTLLARKNGGQ
jgi:succinate dehydrogenase/fumarate reductase flavoprotein subunit